jgi:hypothetical protein
VLLIVVVVVLLIVIVFLIGVIFMLGGAVIFLVGGVGDKKILCVDIQPRDYIPAHQCIADFEGEGDVDVVQHRVLVVQNLICPISSCASSAMQTERPPITRGPDSLL